MAILLNRKYSSRIECLYYILKTLNSNYADSGFIISDVKFDPDMDFNVFDYCELKECNFGREYCPFLDNALNNSKCYATQSKVSDTTKSKAASATVRALEALGLVDPTEANGFRISEKGKDLCSYDFESVQWFDLIRNSVLSYGPINAYILKALEQTSPFNSSNLFISYPNTEEPIELSIGSTRDSNTRTVSMLTSWCLTAGLIEPNNNKNSGGELPQLYYRDIVNLPRLTYRKFILTEYAQNYISSNPMVSNPLFYSSLNKNVGSLRERNSTEIRNLTLENNHIVLNRRFAIIYILNHCYLNSFNMTFDTLHNALTQQYCHVFFLPNSDTWDILQSEINICPLAGLMIRLNEDRIEVLNQINLKVLSLGVAEDILVKISEIVGNL